MKLQLISNTVSQVFAKLPAMLDSSGTWELVHAGLGQVSQVLMSGSDADIAVVLLDSDYLIDVYPGPAALERLAAFEEQVRQFRARNRTRLILSNLVLPPHAQLFHQCDLEAARLAVAGMNARLAELAASVPDVAVLDLFGIALDIGMANFYRAKNKFVFQAPYSPLAVSRICALVAQRVAQFQDARKKVCVLDADNTLWGGVLGEDGPAGVQVDNNYPGIIYQTFQRQLLKLKESGVLLAMVTKNNEQDVLDLFRQRAMPLALSDFVAVKANWDRKSESIAQIARDLNLGLSSFVFIDDSQHELEEVRMSLPEVQCERFEPERFLTGSGVLSALPLLQALRITDEDRAKGAQYQAEQSRQAARASFASIDDYIGSLGITITCAVNDERHLARVAQLLNKTNQFNLTCERLSESEVLQLMRRAHVFDFQVQDKFGDMGIVGVLILENGRIRNFLLSCRVLGRKVEDKILAMVCRHPVAAGTLEAVYRAGPKNQQVEHLYDRLGFAPVATLEDGARLYRLESAPADPAGISLTHANPSPAAPQTARPSN